MIRLLRADRRVKEVLAVFNGELFDRIVIVGWRIKRQECFMNVETGIVSWRDVPFFRKKKVVK